MTRVVPVLFVLSLTAWDPMLAQSHIVVRSLTTNAVTRESFGAILGVRQLPSGSVLVSDGLRHRLLLLDPSLTQTTIVLDSTTGSSQTYGNTGVPIIAFGRDSTLFVDLAAQALLVINPSGRIAHAMAVPSGADMRAIAGSQAAMDGRGRLVYRGASRARPLQSGPPRSLLTITMDDEQGLRSNADSVPLFRIDFQKRNIDTIADLKNFFSQRAVRDTTPDGRRTIRTYKNPLPMSDEWSTLADGTVAIVRGHDYHVDWIDTEGHVTSTGKMPFDWKRISDDDKRRIIDSVRVRDSLEFAAIKLEEKSASQPPSGGAGGGRGGGSVDGGRVPVDVSRIPTVQALYVAPTELPDYLPPIRNGAVRGDEDGNLWILPTTSAQSQHGELVYDVVNGKGELFERVRLPLGRMIVGFGRGGVVFMSSGGIKNGFHLERATLK